MEGAEFKLWINKMKAIIKDYHFDTEQDCKKEESFGCETESKRRSLWDQLNDLITDLYFKNRFVQFVSPQVKLSIRKRDPRESLQYSAILAYSANGSH